ncbi:putative dolichyl-phosphate beta-D-mannosyltransferase [Medicago truncatula]|uniref:Putative dolichyl-phosphate beta-D-mannosyltransferase n=1 Tax=Medicago truncatula TaxID=3880 RepID=A0A396IU53_MEDTR|nr:putative dolichyl-phosphate beta-D-mannosyltransferase [Medicago truncatula]
MLTTMLLPIYFVVSLGCYGLLMVGVGLMNFYSGQPSQLLAESVALGSLGIRIQFGRIYGFGPIQRWGVWPPSHGFREYTYQNDIVEAKEYLKQRGVDVGTS